MTQCAILIFTGLRDVTHGWMVQPIVVVLGSQLIYWPDRATDLDMYLKTTRVKLSIVHLRNRTCRSSERIAAGQNVTGCCSKKKKKKPDLSAACWRRTELLFINVCIGTSGMGAFTKRWLISVSMKGHQSTCSAKQQNNFSPFSQNFFKFLLERPN